MKVFTFVFSDRVTSDGPFEQWSAFAESEVEAAMMIRRRYDLGGQDITLVNSFEDRRKSSERRICPTCFSGTQGLTTGMVGCGMNSDRDRFVSFYCPDCKRRVEK